MLHPRDGDRALENLGRIIGPRFSRWPLSLVGTAGNASIAGEELHEPCEAPARVAQALA